MTGTAAQPFNAVGSEGDLVFREALVRGGIVVGRGDRVHDFLNVERYFRTAALDDFHRIPQSIRRHVPLCQIARSDAPYARIIGTFVPP